MVLNYINELNYYSIVKSNYFRLKFRKKSLTITSIPF